MEESRRLKALCVCNGAHVRSVTLARLLNKRGIETLCCGVDKDFSDDTIEMCCSWADVVFIQKDSLEKFRKRFGLVAETGSWLAMAYAKMDTRFDVGPDDWKIPQHPDLLLRLRAMVEAELLRLDVMAARYRP